MSDRGPMGNLTDAQLAEWHILGNQVAKLTAELADAHAQLATANEKFENLTIEYAQLVAKTDATTGDVEEQIRELKSDARRDRQRLCALAQFLPDIVSEFLSTYTVFKPEALAPERAQMVQHAREVLTLLEPFVD